MPNGTDFVSSEFFNLPDEVLRKMRSSAFLTGRTPSKEQTRGVVEAALNVGATRASEREALGKQFALKQEELEIQRSRNEALQASERKQIKFQESGRKLQILAGAGVLTGLALFTPAFSSTGTATTLWGKIWSSLRYKENVSDSESLNSERIYDLKPVSYNYKEDAPVSQSEKENVQYGLIAEEVAEVIPEMVIFDEQGRPDMIDYSKLIVLLLSELQEVKKALSMEVI